jgi:hypothetical protein
MASLEQHKRDCLKLLGNEFEEVHRWLDDCFKLFGPNHRHARHHWQGINEVREKFGDAGAKAALLHILRDCRHVPAKRDYETGYVDALGLKRNWSTSAYIRYGDSDFEELVKEQLKPTALVLWAFLKWEDARNFLAAVTSYSAEDIISLEGAWKEARNRLDDQQLSLTPTSAFTNFQELSSLSPDVQDYFAEMLGKIQQSGIATEGREVSIGYISIDSLTNPFVFIDYELLEDLKPELTGTSPIEVARFAFPEFVSTPMTMVGEPTQRTITFVSPQKTLTVSNARVRATPEGTEVSYVISANATGIVVSETGDRLILRNGIHRAFLLAQLGFKEVPCAYIKESVAVPFVSAAYPTFAPGVLVQPRRPLLTDFLRPELCLQAPVRRSHKVIRISADETMIPVD